MTPNPSPASPAPTLDEIREQQRLSWNKFAPGWKKWDAFTMEFLRPVGEAMLEAAALRPGLRVLDAACGTGEPGLTAARQVAPGGRAVGTDLSDEMVAVAREKAAGLGLSNYEARVADACRLPFEPASFDAALCRMGIMFFPDPAAALREFHRVLAPGGRVALCAWAEPQKNPWATTIADIVNLELGIPKPSPELPGLFRHAKPGSLKALLESAGFRSVSETETGGERGYESAEKYWEMFTEVAAPIAGPLSKAPEPARLKIRDKVLEAARRFLRDGRPVFPWSARVAAASK